MSNDIALVVGLVLAVLVVPAAVSAWSDGRSPRLAYVMALIAIGLITWAQLTGEPVYGFSGIGEAFFRVLARILP